jgi:hypothetical protein
LSQNLPPTSQYPKKYDTDRTLFRVYNTTESVLIISAEQFDTTLYIKPVDADKPEIWADNGYATISGEVLYYENVGVEQYTGKVNALFNCLRSIGGVKSKFNPAGTDIRGFVMAEHHNQLARSIVNTENFIGYSENPDQTTLDWRIRNLNALDQITDDSNCPDVVFYYLISSQSPVTGTTISYVININGNITDFQLDFGDGAIETNALTGTHVYPANFVVDPVLTVNSQGCSKVVSGVERATPRPKESNSLIPVPAPIATSTPIPVIPVFPDLNIPVPSIVPFEFTPPPIIIPRFGDFPSVITFGGNISIPSLISVGPIPSLVVVVDIPSIIVVDNIPSVISLSPVTGTLNFNDCFNVETGQIDIRSLCKANPYPASFGNSGTSCAGTPTVNSVKITIQEFRSLKADHKIGDVRMLLVGPSGTAVLLFALGTNSYTVANFINLTFDDTSGNYITPVSTPTPLNGGTYHCSSNGLQNVNFSAPAPAGPYNTSLSAFSNSAPGGTYTLYVQKFNNDAGYSTCQKVGVIGNASLNVCIANNICFTPSPSPSPSPTPSSSPSVSPSSDPAVSPSSGPSSPINPASPAVSPSSVPSTPIDPALTPNTPSSGPAVPPTPVTPSPSYSPPAPEDCSNCTCEYTYLSDDTWAVTDTCRNRSNSAEEPCSDNCECPVPPVTGGVVDDLMYLPCRSYCNVDCAWQWDGTSWGEPTLNCGNGDCSCEPPITPGTEPGQPGTSHCYTNPTNCSTSCIYTWSIEDDTWLLTTDCQDSVDCYCEQVSSEAPTSFEDIKRYTTCQTNGDTNACAEISPNKACKCTCDWNAEATLWTSDGVCRNVSGGADSFCQCCGNCEEVCAGLDDPTPPKSLQDFFVFEPCTPLSEPGCAVCTGNCYYRCSGVNTWTERGLNNCGGDAGCACGETPTSPCTPNVTPDIVTSCSAQLTPSATPTVTPNIANCDNCVLQIKCQTDILSPSGFSWKMVEPGQIGCHAPGDPGNVGTCAANNCVCNRINETCFVLNETDDCTCMPPTAFNFSVNNYAEDNIYYAIKDPVLTNNKCECLNLSADDASIYFENLGIFSTLSECSKFSNKENAYLLKDRTKLREIEVSINTYNQEYVQKLSEYINTNTTKEINTFVNELGQLSITRSVPSAQKPPNSESINIPEIQFMAVTPQTKNQYVVNPVMPEFKEIKILSNDVVVEEIKIDKIDIQEKEQDVKSIDNNAVNLINILKAKTLFKDVDENEKESTQFKDRS